MKPNEGEYIDLYTVKKTRVRVFPRILDEGYALFMVVWFWGLQSQLSQTFRGCLTNRCLPRADFDPMKSACDESRVFDQRQFVFTLWLFQQSRWLRSHPGSQMEVSIQNTVKDSNGEILTGSRWRKNYPFFNTLPFHSDIPRMDDIAGPLEKALGERSLVGSFGALLVVRRLAICCSNWFAILPIEIGKGFGRGSPFLWYTQSRCRVTGSW